MVEVKEGKTKLSISKIVFFNPRMKLNRDICCAVIRELKSMEEIIFLDLLAASGAKGLRIANEIKCKVALNDANPKAKKLITENAKLNKLNVKVYNKKANLLLQEIEGYNFIDLDPFGSPIPFLDNAILALKKGGYLGVTATDTAPLCSVHPKACLRKYGVIPLKTGFCHEVGMRILIGYIVRTCAKYEKGINCILSHYNEHYFRAYIKIDNGKKKADNSLSKMGYLYYCKRCKNRVYSNGLPKDKICSCGDNFNITGPLWLGKLQEKKFVEKVFEGAYGLVDFHGLKTLQLIIKEGDTPFYYDIHELCKLWKIPAPPMNEIIHELKNMGFEASRTHYSVTAIKTNGDVQTFKKILLNI